jgi:hypothetical protein
VLIIDIIPSQLRNNSVYYKMEIIFSLKGRSYYKIDTR